MTWKAEFHTHTERNDVCAHQGVLRFRFHSDWFAKDACRFLSRFRLETRHVDFCVQKSRATGVDKGATCLKGDHPKNWRVPPQELDKRQFFFTLTLGVTRWRSWRIRRCFYVLFYGWLVSFLRVFEASSASLDLPPIGRHSIGRFSGAVSHHIATQVEPDLLQRAPSSQNPRPNRGIQRTRN